jgi:hypothetical protein
MASRFSLLASRFSLLASQVYNQHSDVKQISGIKKPAEAGF